VVSPTAPAATSYRVGPEQHRPGIRWCEAYVLALLAPEPSSAERHCWRQPFRSPGTDGWAAGLDGPRGVPTHGGRVRGPGNDTGRTRRCPADRPHPKRLTAPWAICAACARGGDQAASAASVWNVPERPNLDIGQISSRPQRHWLPSEASYASRRPRRATRFSGPVSVPDRRADGDATASPKRRVEARTECPLRAAVSYWLVLRRAVVSLGRTGDTGAVASRRDV